MPIEGGPLFDRSDTEGGWWEFLGSLIGLAIVFGLAILEAHLG